ncbi:MAG TPA: hypothetical protein VF260_04450 [Bacilli bacterium]
MFEPLIRQKLVVQIFDAGNKLLATGVITGINEQKGFLKLNRKLLFPLRIVAKIQILSDRLAEQKSAAL